MILLMDWNNPASVVDLANIRDVLIRMEDTVLFDLIERSQFMQNPLDYQPNAFPALKGTFLDWFLSETERTHSKVRRYDAPDENAFFPEVLEPSILPELTIPEVLAPYQKEINVNSQIKEFYISKIIPAISVPGNEPQNLGSCAVCDVNCLQSISRRVHFGKFVAESKFLSETDRFIHLIKNKDVAGLDAAISNMEVERQVLDRVRAKADSYGTDPSLRYSEKKGLSKVDPDVIMGIYRDCIIPLTKIVEVDYLLRRLDAY